MGFMLSNRGETSRENVANKRSNCEYAEPRGSAYGLPRMDSLLLLDCYVTTDSAQLQVFCINTQNILPTQHLQIPQVVRKGRVRAAAGRGPILFSTNTWSNIGQMGLSIRAWIKR